jgi:Fe-S-cluster-containing dehydrogenase component
MEKIERRQFIKLGLFSTAGVMIGSFFAFANTEKDIEVKGYEDLLKFDWGYIVDTTRCIGCGSCVRACKVENDVPDTFFRTWVERYEISDSKKVHVDSPNGAIESFKENNTKDSEIDKAYFVPKLCNHCYDSPCTQVCPVGASYRSPDGVVLIDKKHCVGCGYCVQACPYGCRYIDESKGVADKCTFCYHRIHKGEAPACVNACPRNARIYGNLKDPNSKINKILNQRRYGVLKPDLGTNPKCFYIGIDKEVI